MKLSRFATLMVACGLICLLAVLAGCSWVLATARAANEELELNCRARVNRALLSATIDGFPVRVRIFELIKARRIEDAERLSVTELWGDLGFAWKANKESGSISNVDLYRVLTNSYPELREKVDLSRLHLKPLFYRTETTNFINEVDALLHLGHQ